MDEASSRPLPAVVQQTGHKEIAVYDTEATQLRYNVEAVAPVGREHPIEELELARFEPFGQFVPLSGRYPGACVRPGSPDL
jgi:hypothetical protein